MQIYAYFRTYKRKIRIFHYIFQSPTALSFLGLIALSLRMIPTSLSATTGNPSLVIPTLSRNLKHLVFPNKFPIFAAHLWDFVPTNECNLLLNN